MSDLKMVYTTNDGKVFNTKAEANDYLRRPKQLVAFKALTEGNEELATWLVDNDEVVKNAFDKGTIKRVSKSERKKLIAALEAVSEIHKETNNTALAFMADNAESIAEGFRWPSVKRLDPEEKMAAIKEEIAAATEGNEELAVWIIEHKDQVLEAYDAGKVKREVSPKASAALAKWREEQKAAKEAAEKAAS